MSKFYEITGEEFTFSPFYMIGNEWMLITAEKDGKVNSMTASWGGLGVMWNKNVAYVVIRDSRYTKELIDQSDSFSLSFFNHEENKKMLGYMGSVSGRDENKIEKMNLTLNYVEDTPYFDEAKIVILCKKMCCQRICPESFVLDEIDRSFYKDKDYHNLYIGEIKKILKRDE